MISISYSTSEPGYLVPYSISSDKPVFCASDFASRDLAVHPKITLAPPASTMFFCTAADIYLATVIPGKYSYLFPS